MNKKMLFKLGAELMLVEILGDHPTIKDGVYIRYSTGGTDTTKPRFLFEIPEQLTILDEGVIKV